MPRLLRVALALLALVAAGFLACGLLPERYAFNAPVLHTIFGRGGGDAPGPESFGSRIQVAPGFSIGPYADGLAGVRMLEALPDGSLLASAPRRGTVWHLAPDADGDGRSDGRSALLTGLDRPHGLAVHEGFLYVAEADGVGRARIDPSTGALRGPLERVVDDLPEGGNHWTRSVGVGPDGWLYVSVGSSCNACFEQDERRAAMLRYRLDGSEGEIYATGLRNSVGFDWRPATGALYATDNGRDLLGDDFPPCELNRVVRGAFYGWPVANGDRVPDPEHGEGHAERIAASLPPAHGFRAHNAPLGIHFLRHPEQPAGYRGSALVALHGSWNRTEKDGYEVVSLHWEEAGGIAERPFVWGFELDEDVIGRPVDVAEGPDGAIFVSDDYAGAVYRVMRGARSAPPAGAGAASATAAALARSDGDALAAGTADLARGAALWSEHDCARCHEAERAAPGVVAVPLEALPDRYDAASLADFLAAPTPPMPSFPLDAAERRDLGAHLLERFAR